MTDSVDNKLPPQEIQPNARKAYFYTIMADHIQVIFEPITGEQAEQALALLSAEGYEGFEEGDGYLKAYVPDREFDEPRLSSIADLLQIRYTTEVVKETNWNAVWESNFEPVIVEDPVTRQPWAGIRAHFHTSLTSVEHEIVITPKMSFGTGHHATTYMMMQQMKGIDFSGKTVFDFGTGTGVLSILSEKTGAADILAVDNDDWSIENTIENITHNHCTKITVQKADTVPSDRQFDIILANINKNVILGHLSGLKEILAPHGTLLLSGLLAEDESDIKEAALLNRLRFRGMLTRNNWICIVFSH